MKYLILTTTLAFSITAHAQQPFDSVKATRIRPADLPSPEESVLPEVLRGAVLPKATTQAEIDQMFTHARTRAVEVLVELPPTSSLQRGTIQITGQAFWLSAHPDGKNPVLVTPAHWLDKATRIWVRPADTLHARDIPQAQVTPLQTVSLNPRKHTRHPDFQPATLQYTDPHRNLATLESKLTPPDTGLTFFPMQNQSPTHIYGVSALPHPPRPATILPSDPEGDIVFYLISDFTIALGASLLAPDTRIIALTAMHHPKDPAKTLITPPLALQRFVETAQGLRNPVLEQTVDPEP